MKSIPGDETEHFILTAFADENGDLIFDFVNAGDFDFRQDGMLSIPINKLLEAMNKDGKKENPRREGEGTC
jgi:hypothetical protein